VPVNAPHSAFEAAAAVAPAPSAKPDEQVPLDNGEAAAEEVRCVLAHAASWHVQ
jgi:hypothetical protein